MCPEALNCVPADANECSISSPAHGFDAAALHDDRRVTPDGAPAPPAWARAGLDDLARRDADLARVEAAAGPLPWRRRSVGFAGLLQAIVGQQISNQAAAAIWRRVAALPGATDPAGLAALDDETLRGAGLSRPKVAHARALATAFADGRLEAAALASLDDEAAIAAIAGVRGLGRWSAEVYLLFALERPDVFPAADLALAAAAADLKALPGRPGPAALRDLAEPWRPWRALAARLLWHHWRHLTGRPAMDDLTAGG
jgi:DNA-3-methyladenine glycosylase II